MVHTRLVAFAALAAVADALTFTSPTSATVFSSTQPNTISFTTVPTDPPLIDIYIYSASPSEPFGPSRLRPLASSVSPLSSPLVFAAGGDGVLPPGTGYAVVAVRRGGRRALAVSDAFNVSDSTAEAASAAATATDASIPSIAAASRIALPSSAPSSSAVVGPPESTYTSSTTPRTSPSAVASPASTSTAAQAPGGRWGVTGSVAPGGPAQQGTGNGEGEGDAASSAAGGVVVGTLGVGVAALVLALGLGAL